MLKNKPEPQTTLRKELTKEYTTRCLFGTCPDCSYLTEGGGVHITRIYTIYEYVSEKCEECDGEGQISEECPECDGFGDIDAMDEKSEIEECANCDGFGEIEKMCDECHGTGKQPINREEGKEIREIVEIVKKEAKNVR
jgi:DnaJ-class molecular chaperone